MMMMRGLVVYSWGNFEGVRTRRVRCGAEGWARAMGMKTRPVAPVRYQHEHDLKARWSLTCGTQHEDVLEVGHVAHARDCEVCG